MDLPRNAKEAADLVVESMMIRGNERERNLLIVHKARIGSWVNLRKCLIRSFPGGDDMN